MLFLLMFAMGFLTGLRSLTPAAATAWAARLGWIKLPGALLWIGSLWSAALFSLLAIGELVADKLPATPARTAAAGLTARVVLGGLVGSTVATAGGRTFPVGLALGVMGALAGAFGGYQIRTRLVKALGVPDFVIALVEDVVAVGGSIGVLLLLGRI